MESGRKSFAFDTELLFALPSLFTFQALLARLHPIPAPLWQIHHMGGITYFLFSFQPPYISYGEFGVPLPPVMVISDEIFITGRSPRAPERG